MTAELLYTSAAKGLKPGSRGFCTVVSSAGMPTNLASKLESLSGYRQMFLPSDPNAAKNPVAFSHLTFSLGGQQTSILSRVAAYGADYSGRTNKLAHHVVPTAAEKVAAGPAWLLMQPGVMRTDWDGNCQTTPAGPAFPNGNVAPGLCHAWQRLAGDAGWGGVVADAFRQSRGKPLFVIFSLDHRNDLLQLIVEATALLPPEQRWQATFSTYATQLPPDVSCQVRFVVEGTQDAQMARARGTVIHLGGDNGALPSSDLVDLARGKAPAPSFSAPAASAASPAADLAGPAAVASAPTVPAAGAPSIPVAPGGKAPALPNTPALPTAGGAWGNDDFGLAPAMPSPSAAGQPAYQMVGDDEHDAWVDPGARRSRSALPWIMVAVAAMLLFLVLGVAGALLIPGSPFALNQSEQDPSGQDQQVTDPEVGSAEATEESGAVGEPTSTAASSEGESPSETKSQVVGQPGQVAPEAREPGAPDNQGAQQTGGGAGMSNKPPDPSLKIEESPPTSDGYITVTVKVSPNVPCRMVVPGNLEIDVEGIEEGKRGFVLNATEIWDDKREDDKTKEFISDGTRPEEFSFRCKDLRERNKIAINDRTREIQFFTGPKKNKVVAGAVKIESIAGSFDRSKLGLEDSGLTKGSSKQVDFSEVFKASWKEGWTIDFSVVDESDALQPSNPRNPPKDFLEYNYCLARKDAVSVKKIDNQKFELSRLADKWDFIWDFEVPFKLVVKENDRTIFERSDVPIKLAANGTPTLAIDWETSLKGQDSVLPGKTSHVRKRVPENSSNLVQARGRNFKEAYACIFYSGYPALRFKDKNNLKGQGLGDLLKIKDLTTGKNNTKRYPDDDSHLSSAPPLDEYFNTELWDRDQFWFGVKNIHWDLPSDVVQEIYFDSQKCNAFLKRDVECIPAKVLSLEGYRTNQDLNKLRDNKPVVNLFLPPLINVSGWKSLGLALHKQQNPEVLVFATIEDSRLAGKPRIQDEDFPKLYLELGESEPEGFIYSDEKWKSRKPELVDFTIRPILREKSLLGFTVSEKKDLRDNVDFKEPFKKLGVWFKEFEKWDQERDTDLEVGEGKFHKDMKDALENFRDQVKAANTVNVRESFSDPKLPIFLESREAIKKSFDAAKDPFNVQGYRTNLPPKPERPEKATDEQEKKYKKDMEQWMKEKDEYEKWQSLTGRIEKIVLESNNNVEKLFKMIDAKKVSIEFEQDGEKFKYEIPSGLNLH